MKIKNIVIIPARANSKRLPNKNRLLFSDVPLITHSINYAKANLDIISDVYVSTNDENVKSLALTVDNVILLQPTNPLRQKQLLKEAYTKYIEGDFDSLMTVSINNKKLGKINAGRFEPYNYKMGQRSQDMEPLYFENGLLYISKTNLILNDAILGSKNCPFIVNHPYASVDIDTSEDLKYAQFILDNYPNE